MSHHKLPYPILVERFLPHLKHVQEGTFFSYIPFSSLGELHMTEVMIIESLNQLKQTSTTDFIVFSGGEHIGESC